MLKRLLRVDGACPGRCRPQVRVPPRRFEPRRFIDQSWRFITAYRIGLTVKTASWAR